jgi:hypothetical protein
MKATYDNAGQHRIKNGSSKDVPKESTNELVSARSMLTNSQQGRSLAGCGRPGQQNPRGDKMDGKMNT